MCVRLIRNANTSYISRVLFKSNQIYIRRFRRVLRRDLRVWRVFLELLTFTTAEFLGRLNKLNVVFIPFLGVLPGFNGDHALIFIGHALGVPGDVAAEFSGLIVRFGVDGGVLFE